MELVEDIKAVSMNTHAALLRVLESCEVMPVGRVQEVVADYNEINKLIKKMEHTDINLLDTVDLFEKFLLKRSLTIHKSYTKAAKALELPKPASATKNPNSRLIASF